MGSFWFIFAGIGLGIVAMFLWDEFVTKDESKIAGVVMAVFIGVFIIVFFVSSLGWGAIGIIVGIPIGYFLMNYEGKHTSDSDKNFSKQDKRPYISHCWNCNHPIDSRVDHTGPQCHQHYICPKCGKCWCDDPRHKS